MRSDVSIDEVFVRSYSHAVHQTNGFGGVSEAEMFTLVEEERCTGMQHSA